MCASRASASTSSGRSYSRSIRSRTRRNRARSRRCCAEAVWGETPVALRKELNQKDVNKHIYNRIEKRGEARRSPLLANAHQIPRLARPRRECFSIPDGSGGVFVRPVRNQEANRRGRV